MTELTRFREGDVLSIMLLELVRDGLRLKPWQCDERMIWTSNCRQLLASVPDEAQRWAWRLILAQSLAATMEGCPVVIVMKELESP